MYDRNTTLLAREKKICTTTQQTKEYRTYIFLVKFIRRIYLFTPRYKSILTYISPEQRRDYRKLSFRGLDN